MSEPPRKPPAGFGGKRGLIWVIAAYYVVPLMMSLAYVFLMLTSETDTGGKLWESGGLAAVLFLYWLFLRLTRTAAMSRAVLVGDSERVLELTDLELRRRRSPQASARFHVYRALAREIRGEWDQALAELDRVKLDGTWRLLGATVRVAALAETGRAGEARQVFDAELAAGARARDAATQTQVRLAEARLRWAEGDLAGAEPLLARIIDDVRAGAGIRAVAHEYAARIAESRGDASGAATHRAQAAKIAPERPLPRAAVVTAKAG